METSQRPNTIFMKYKIVTHTNPADLSALIESMLADGWRFHGSTQSTAVAVPRQTLQGVDVQIAVVFSQAMIHGAPFMLKGANE